MIVERSDQISKIMLNILKVICYFVPQSEQIWLANEIENFSSGNCKQYQIY